MCVIRFRSGRSGVCSVVVLVIWVALEGVASSAYIYIYTRARARVGAWGRETRACLPVGEFPGHGRGVERNISRPIDRSIASRQPKRGIYAAV